MFSNKKTYYSVFDLFKVGIGPSSSHTVGPMIAAKTFIKRLSESKFLEKAEHVKVDLFGSLALTGEGHGTVDAIVNGLLGEVPESVVTNPLSEHDRENCFIERNGLHPIRFSVNNDLTFKRSFLPGKHPNFIRFYALDSNGHLLTAQEFSSIGGGEIVEGKLERSEITESERTDKVENQQSRVPYPFKTASELLQICKKTNMPVSRVVLENEISLRTEKEFSEKLSTVINVMNSSVERGLVSTEKFLPGRIKLQRRAPELFPRIKALDDIERLSLYALAVSEENAAGGRIVTSPTNGSAGVIPGLIYFYLKNSPESIKKFLLTAAAIGVIYKHCASISAAEVGCQGEIGVSSSMAAAGLVSIMTDNDSDKTRRIMNAAEIAMEHHLGLTCDPVHGLVQVPCIERNAMGAVKALLAAKLAIIGDENQTVSLDTCIKTMYRTGLAIHSDFKETSAGGLAEHFKDSEENIAINC